MKVLVVAPISDEGIDILRSYAQVDIKLGLKLKEIISIIGDYEALVVRSQTEVSARVIEAGKKLQVIGRAGVGVDNINVEEATRRGIVVVNAPTGNTISAAEHTIALMLAQSLSNSTYGTSFLSSQFTHCHSQNTSYANNNITFQFCLAIGYAV